MPTTVATAVTALRERLDEVTAAQWLEVQLRRWLNEGIRDIARRTHHYIDTDTIAVVVDTGEYTVAADVLRINHAYYTPTGDTTRYPLIARAWEGMNQIWGSRSEQGGGYPAVFTTFGYSPNVKIKLFPTPSVAGSLYLHVARLPADLDITGGSGNVDCPEGWIEVAYDYAEYMALRKDRDPRWEESYQMYQDKVGVLLEAGSYINAPGEFIFDGGGMVPTWLADPNWY